MERHTLEWLKETTHLLRIQKGNVNSNRTTLFKNHTDEWVEGYQAGYTSIIEQFSDIISIATSSSTLTCPTCECLQFDVTEEQSYLVVEACRSEGSPVRMPVSFCPMCGKRV